MMARARGTRKGKPAAAPACPDAGKRAQRRDHTLGGNEGGSGMTASTSEEIGAPQRWVASMYVGNLILLVNSAFLKAFVGAVLPLEALPGFAWVDPTSRCRLEPLCRSLRRPPLALVRLTEPSEGQLHDQFRRPWADGSAAWRLTPLERLERLTALVPAPRTHGLDQLLAPHAAWRAAIVLEPAAGAPGPSPPPVLRCVPVLQATRGLEKDRS